jgi:hypothetical protein
MASMRGTERGKSADTNPKGRSTIKNKLTCTTNAILMANDIFASSSMLA